MNSRPSLSSSSTSGSQGVSRYPSGVSVANKVSPSSMLSRFSTSFEITTPEGGMDELRKIFRLNTNVLFACLLFLPVLFHPGFPAPACRGIAIGKLQSGNIGVSNGDFLAGLFGIQTDKRIHQSPAVAAVKDVPFDFASVFAGNRDVSPVVEGLFEGSANFFFAGQLWNPAFELFMLKSRDNFQRIRILYLRFGAVRHAAHTRASSC